LIILSSLSSCEEGCFTSDQFDSYSETVNANPSNDGIKEISILKDFANWHETDLRSNGDEFLIRITGSWTPWGGSSMSTSTLETLPICSMCARKNDGTSPNCICLEGDRPLAYPGKICDPGNYSHENDPTACTCTTDPSEGYNVDPELNLAYSEAVHYSALNYYEKDGTVKLADHQSRCKFTQGAGLYIGLFGPTGTLIPDRVYHLYSPTKVCNVIPNDEGECLDSSGEDKTSYQFSSKNARIFIRDDNAGNLGTDTYTEDDTYHTSNEVVKFKIYDEEYTNNFGQYNLQILRGIGDSSDRSQVGLLEYMVRLIEDAVLGEINGNDERVGGIIEFMYKAIVQDSGFMGFLKMCLILYVAIYGMAILSGVAEISKKEIMSRILKIGLVLLFTSSNSWQLYNDIVVGFFLDGMNSVITMINSLSIQALDIDNSSAILGAQMDRSSNVSSSTRFTYIDNTIIMLMSEAVAAKTFGLILASPFGILYVIVIYALIGIFIAIMAYAATVYVINVLKIIFVLSLGPLFIVFVLFGQTSQMFKNWISFLAGRSMEIIILFLVLFNFVVLLNTTFIEMFSYTTCVETLDLYLFKIPYLHSYANRSLMEWTVYFMKILGLSFMTYLVLEKVGDIAGQLISVGGAGNQSSSGGSRGRSGFALASKFISGAAGVAGEAAGKAALVSGYAGLAVGKGASVVARESGLSGAMSGAARSIGRATGLSQASKAIGHRIPLSIKNPREFIRDQKYKGIISRAKKDVERQSGGLVGAEKDQAIRSRALAIFENSKMNDKLANKAKIGKGEMHTHNMLGMGYETFAKSLHREMVEKPLMNEIKKQAKEMQSSRNPGGPMFGKEMKAELNKFAIKWADKELAGGSDAVRGMLENKSDINRSKFEFQLNRKIENSSRLDAATAGKAFYGKPEKLNAFSSHLQDLKNDQNSRTARLDEERDKYKGRLAPIREIRKAAGAVYRGARSMTTENYRPDLAQKNLARGLENQKVAKEGTMGQYIGNKLNLTNKSNATAAGAAMIKKALPKISLEAKNASDRSKVKKQMAAKVADATKEFGKVGAYGAVNAALLPSRMLQRSMGYNPKKLETDKQKLASEKKEWMGKQKGPEKVKEQKWQREQESKTKAKEQEKEKEKAKPELIRTDRKTALDQQANQARSTLRDKLSSSNENNVNKTIGSKFFSDRNVDATLVKDLDSKGKEQYDDNGKLKYKEDFTRHKSDLTTDKEGLKYAQVEDKFKDKGDLEKERQAFEKNRLDRGTMQSQLAKEAVSSLDSKSVTDLKDSQGAGLDRMVKGDNDSAFEKAARLQHINGELKLGEKDFKKDLMEKFNAEVNKDIDETSAKIKGAVERKDAEAYKSSMKELESIKKSKASVFSDFEDKEAGDDKYKDFLDKHIKDATKDMQNRINGKTGKPGQDESAKEDPKPVTPEKKLSKEEEFKKEKAANDAIYLNDQDLADKLANIDKEKADNDKKMEEDKDKDGSGMTIVPKKGEGNPDKDDDDSRDPDHDEDNGGPDDDDDDSDKSPDHKLVSDKLNELQEAKRILEGRINELKANIQQKESEINALDPKSPEYSADLSRLTSEKDSMVSEHAEKEPQIDNIDGRISQRDVVE